MCVNGVQKISMNNLKRATVPLFFATKIKPKYPKIKIKIKIQHFWFQFSYLLISKFSLHYNENTKSTVNVALRKKNLQTTTPKGEHTSEWGDKFWQYAWQQKGRQSLCFSINGGRDSTRCGGIKIHVVCSSVCIFYTRMGCIYIQTLSLTSHRTNYT